MSVPEFPSASEATHEEGLLDGRSGVRLYWRRFAPSTTAARSLVAVVHGGGDHSGRYAGVTSALVRAGHEVALLDLRGHGRSGGSRWYVDAFSDYVEDLEALVAKLRADARGRPVFVVAHSMGALVTILWGLSPARGVSGVVLSQPFLAAGTAPPALKVLAGRLLGRIVPLFRVKTGFGASELTSDPEMQAWTDADPLYLRSTTARWIGEALRVTDIARRRAPEFAYPLLVLLGTADRVASYSAGRAFFEGAGSSYKELRTYEGFRHELFNESRRERPFADTVAWIDARARRAAARSASPGAEARS
jgi:alpha-beta hydrolase superfamily lysophospholipase